MSKPPRPMLDDLTPHQIESLTTRFWAKVDQSGGPDACWPWKDATLHGYGVFRAGKRKVKAHRFAYVLAIGLEPGETIDHRCHDSGVCNPVNGADCPHRACCNPRHIKSETTSGNVRRAHWERAQAGNARPRQHYGGTPAGVRRDVTACVRGHDFTPENTYTDASGSRHCRACASQLMQASAHPTGWVPEPTGDDRVTCRSGRHEWSEAGTYEDRGVRKCRDCDRERKARYRARRKESPGAGSVPGATITKEHDEH